MEFAKPLLALTRWKLKVFPVSPSANLCSIAAPAPASPNQSENIVVQNAYLNVFTMRKSRTRSKATRSAAPPSPRLSLPLQTDADAALATARTLKIVQREPSKQPECLLISGRMADVCAALENMARNERAMQA